MDTLDPRAPGFADFSAAMATTSQAGADTVFAFDVNETVTFLGVSHHEITADSLLV